LLCMRSVRPRSRQRAWQLLPCHVQQHGEPLVRGQQ
jgi:hypothetical protein